MRIREFYSIGVAAVVILLCAEAPARAVREYGGWFTKERIANLRANCRKYDWARKERDKVVARAEPFVNLSDDFFWRFLPGQKLPRALHVCRLPQGTQFCPACGQKVHRFGQYPFSLGAQAGARGQDALSVETFTKPWKVACRSCGEVFPKNDFGKYYEGGVDETGRFDPERADRSLLYNEEHPDPKDPLHMYGVDDGSGWVDKEGNRFHFIGYYSHWVQVNFLTPYHSLFSPLSALAEAYVYTGEQKYAHKALIVLDRLADLYSEYSGGYGGGGKITDGIWECGQVEYLARTVDMVISGTREDPLLYAFLARKAEEYKLPRPKGTRDLLIRNLDDGILREGAKAVLARTALGNEGMHQAAITACAIALNQNPETEQWLDWLFDPRGGRLPDLIVGKFDRDGVGDEVSPAYSSFWALEFLKIADWLRDYEGYTRHDLYREFPKMRAITTGPWNLAILGYAVPNIGDSGQTGLTDAASIVEGGAGPSLPMRGYRRLKDPKNALAAYYANRENMDGLGRDIYGSDPNGLGKEVARIVAGRNANPFRGGRNRAGYGLASVEFGWGKPGIALWMYYGDNFGVGNHGHRDRLNLGLYYKGVCMMPDHGYPEDLAGDLCRYFTKSTISHNTVVVNQIEQRRDRGGGYPELYCRFEDFGAVRVDSPQVYGVDKYQRTVAFVKLGDGQAYALDVFRVRGGNDHLYTLHGPPGKVSVEGLKLIRQETGTYADVAAPGPRYGYQWIWNVEHDNDPPGAFVVDWKAESGYRGVPEEGDIHLRYHSLTELSDMALGDGKPPQHSIHNPRWLRYLLAHRAGKNLTSTFVGIIEPYSNQPAIVSVKKLGIRQAPEESAAVAVKVTLRDGAVDYLVASDDDRGAVRAAEGLEFAGAIGWLRVRGGKVRKAALVRGTHLSLGEFELSLPEAGHTGKIVKMDKDMSGRGYVWVDTRLPVDGRLAGAQMIIENDRVQNACYTIESVEEDGSRWKVSLGEVSFVRGYTDENDYGAGYVYHFEEGAGFMIPHHVHAEWRGSPRRSYKVRGTTSVRPIRTY